MSSSSTVNEFALPPKASDDDASEPGTAYTITSPSPSPPPSGSPLYLAQRTNYNADMERATRRATLIEQQFGMSYPCDFGDCTDVLPSARALACHLHIHYIAMELPEERGLTLPSFYSGDDYEFTPGKSPTAAHRAVAAAKGMMDFALKLWAALVWLFWR